MFSDPVSTAAQAPVPGAAPAASTPDAQNPAARAFAMMRMRQLVRSGLIGGMPQGGSADPTEEWRMLSQGLGSDPGRLAQFQAAASPVPHDPAIDAHQALAAASPRQQLAAMATARAVAKTMQHLRQLRPYGGPH